MIRSHPVINFYKVIFNDNLNKQFFNDSINDLVNSMSLTIGRWSKESYDIKQDNAS